MSEDLRAEAPLWLLIDQGKCTLRELEEEWSLDDVNRAFAMMAFKGCMEQMSMDRMTQNTKRT